MSDQINTTGPKHVASAFLGQQRRPADAAHGADVAGRVFLAMHGFYGNLWLNKFATHMVTADGRDEGVENARRTWGSALARYSLDVVRAALGKCLGDKPLFPEFPPSLPQFVAVCESCRPRETYRPPDNAIGMSAELRSSYTRRLREVNEKHLQKARDLRSGVTTRENDAGLSGLPLLNSLIAEAIGLAGGDEAAALLRLERSLLSVREFGQQTSQTRP